MARDRFRHQHPDGSPDGLNFRSDFIRPIGSPVESHSHRGFLTRTCTLRFGIQRRRFRRTLIYSYKCRRKRFLNRRRRMVTAQETQTHGQEARYGHENSNEDEVLLHSGNGEQGKASEGPEARGRVGFVVKGAAQLGQRA